MNADYRKVRALQCSYAGEASSWAVAKVSIQLAPEEYITNNSSHCQALESLGLNGTTAVHLPWDRLN
jgi:hypothetical protein